MKARPSKLDAVAEVLSGWFRVEHLTLDAARVRLQSEHGITVSSGRLSTWWAAEQQRLLQREILGRVASGSQMAADIEKQFGANPPPELETIMRLLRVLTLQVSVSGAGDPEMLDIVSRLTKTLIDGVKLQQAGQSLKLEKDRFEFSASEACLKHLPSLKLIETSTATQAEKIDQIRLKLFGEDLPT